MTASRSFLAAAAVMFGAAAHAQEPIILERAVIRDKMASSANQDAVHFLMPKGWTMEGGIVWYLNHVHQANCEVRIRNPQGTEQIETFPFKTYTWRERWVIPFPQGSNYLGSEVQPPLSDPREYVRSYVLPRHRPGARIVSYQELLEVGRAATAAGSKVRAGRTRIEYEHGGRTMEEDIYVVLGVSTFNDGTGNVWIWAPDRVFGLRAAKGELDQRSNLLLSVVNSAQLKPGWFGEYLMVCELFKARMYQGIAAAKALSDQIAANSESIRKMISDSYWQRQASQDRVNQNFSDYIRGVTRYNDPNERYPVQLPSGYNQVWANASGQYILSNNALFNPNEGGTQNWTLLQQAK